MPEEIPWRRLGVLRKDFQPAERLRAVLLRREELMHNLRLLILTGYFTEHVATASEIADWLRPEFRGNLPARLVTRLGSVFVADDNTRARGGAIARAAFGSLTPSEQKTVTQTVLEVVADTKDEFYGYFPQFKQPSKEPKVTT